MNDNQILKKNDITYDADTIRHLIVDIVEKNQNDFNEIDLEILEPTFAHTKHMNKTNDIFKEYEIKCSSNSLSTQQWEALSGRVKMLELLAYRGNLSFSQTMEKVKSRLHEDFYMFVEKNAVELNKIINYNLNNKFNLFSLETLEKSYLLKIKEKNKIITIETPQDLYMRVATFLYYDFDNVKESIKSIKQVYNHLSKGYYTHATPTLFNAGLKIPQLASCVLMSVEDSLDNSPMSINRHWQIQSTLSKRCMGQGVDYSAIRGTQINDTFMSDGLVPLLKVSNSIANYVNQCFHHTTKVFTRNGFIEINKINTQDEILVSNSLNNILYKKVNKIFEYNNVDNKKSYKISLMFNYKDSKFKQTNYVLEGHPILVELNGYPEYVPIEQVYQNNLKLIVSTGLEEPTIQLLPNTCLLISKVFSNQVFFHKGNVILQNNEDNILLKHLGLQPIFIKDYIGYVYSYKNTNMFPFKFSLLMDKLELVRWITTNCSSIVINQILNNMTSYNEKEIVFNMLYTLSMRNGDIAYTHEITEYETTGTWYDLEIDTKEDNEHNFITNTCTAHNGGKRQGSITAYLSIWHLNVEQFIEARKKEGSEQTTAKDLFYALWICDLFMKRYEEDKEWFLICPNYTNKLYKKYGKEFEEEYLDLEQKALNNELPKMAYKFVSAKSLMHLICQNQISEGMPFILFSDHINRKCNQNNLGTIRCSNLCTEITEYTDEYNIASCNLASIALSQFFIKRDGEILLDRQFLEKMTRQVVRNLNNVIDKCYYPSNINEKIPEIEYTNLRNRPLGIGIQGLADLFAIMDLPWVVIDRELPQMSDKWYEDFKHLTHHDTVTNKYYSLKLNPLVAKLNDQIFETIYYSAISESIEIAKEKGVYETFQGSLTSKGIFQFDMWEDKEFLKDTIYDWEALRKEMMCHGLRNSILIALMPTASTAQILGNTEAFEPCNSMVYTRKVLSGSFIVINKHLYKEMNQKDLWTDDNIKNIIKHEGSVQYCNIPNEMKLKYRTVWEIPQTILQDLHIQRSKFVCQTSSFNIFIEAPVQKDLSTLHLRGWKKGIKTGMYYLRSKPASGNTDYIVDSLKVKRKVQHHKEPEECLHCSS